MSQLVIACRIAILPEMQIPAHANILVNKITNDIMRIENEKPSTIPKSMNSLPMIFTSQKNKEPLQLKDNFLNR